MPKGIYKHKSHSEETKRKMSEWHKGKPSPMKGKHYSETSKRKMRRQNHFREKASRWKGGITKNGHYIAILLDNGKYGLEHRLIMENFLGKKLSHNEIIHHINGNTKDNRIENLKLLDGQSEHAKLHGFGKRI